MWISQLNRKVYIFYQFKPNLITNVLITILRINPRERCKQIQLNNVKRLTNKSALRWTRNVIPYKQEEKWLQRIWIFRTPTSRTSLSTGEILERYTEDSLILKGGMPRIWKCFIKLINDGTLLLSYILHRWLFSSGYVIMTDLCITR